MYCYVIFADTVLSKFRSERKRGEKKAIRVPESKGNHHHGYGYGYECQQFMFLCCRLQGLELVLGLGGDTSYWNNFEWDDRKMKAAKAAFDTSVDCGISFFDTAEVYGSRFSFGAINSETLLGRFIKERKVKDPEVEVAVATKYAALPWRLGRQSVLTALKDSLNRLELSSVELYQLHWPEIWGNEGYIDGLGDAVEQGLVKAVGVSNYSESRLRDAYKKLEKRGIPLASNQVNYSLIYRAPEGKWGFLQESILRKIHQLVLEARFTLPSFLTKLQPLLNRIKEIGENYSKTNTQVVLNWLVAQENVIPIPGGEECFVNSHRIDDVSKTGLCARASRWSSIKSVFLNYS
ncbi:AFLATOXIN B1 ALDEHYDE REDUCTASE [Salix viminalis]|uniref:AFLATOXIN B1 ALDEHYDE REDUCTASE n=1 Tax=Salix viminalis TaxID=40686 RepID=A0A9Q0ZIW9_SALVM|nr:AFLATOXIN B1 ALDEHYDE REDUCTASE [Salix viminalis]